MNEEKMKIFELLSQGKISVEEAARLSESLESNQSKNQDRTHESNIAQKKFLRISVNENNEDSDGDKVDIRIPLKLIRAGIKLGSLLPTSAQDHINDKMAEKGIKFQINDISNSKQLEELLDAITGMEINVNGNKGKGEQVKIYCE